MEKVSRLVEDLVRKSRIVDKARKDERADRGGQGGDRERSRFSLPAPRKRLGHFINAALEPAADDGPGRGRAGDFRSKRGNCAARAPCVAMRPREIGIDIGGARVGRAARADPYGAGRLVERSLDGSGHEIVLRGEMSVKGAVGEAGGPHDLAHSHRSEPTFTEKGGGSIEDLIVALRRQLGRISHSWPRKVGSDAGAA